MPQNNKLMVLFLSTANAARSQMAEVLLRTKGAAYFDVYSAGTHPEPIDKRTLQAIRLYDLSDEGLSSKHINDFSGEKFDYVITLCENANSECRDYPGAAQQLAWDCPDPNIRLTDNPFFSTLEALNSRINMFISITADINVSKPKSTETKPNKAIKPAIDPITFYKCLTDDIRLKTLMLTYFHGELCVCELMHALQEDSQPKVSRNLAVLKKANLLSTRKHGQWVFYRINVDLPQWSKSVIAQTTENNAYLIKEALQRLTEMQTRPNKTSICG